MKKKDIVKSLYTVLLKTGFKDSYILEIVHYSDTLKVNIKLSPQRELEHLLTILPNLKMEMGANDCKIGKIRGKIVELLFGMRELTKIDFDKKYIHPNTLKVELPSAYGSSILDFSDGASCHMLNGGTTRMGKTSLLLYLSTILYIQTKGFMKLYITSTKIKDFYPFKGLKDVHLGRTDEDFLHQLSEIKEEYQKRDQLLYSKELEKATDAKSVKKLYPNKYYLFKPIFIIIDEYARFSENKAIQKIVTELVETAGYVNVHVIVSTQRPDAKNVLPARLKANLLARICFTTTDKNNSMIILDQFGAEKLGKIEGRALYLDGELNTIQIPYIEPIECEKLLQPFRSENNETHDDEKTTRSINHQLSEKIQGLFEESISNAGIQGKQQSSECVQQGYKTVSNGWFDLANKKNKR